MGQSRDSDLAPLRPAGALACIGKGARKSPLIRPTGFARRSVSRPAGALTCIRRGARKSPLIRPAGFARRSVPNLSGPRFHRRVGLCLFGHNPTFRPEACRGLTCIRRAPGTRLGSVPQDLPDLPSRILSGALTYIRRAARKSPLIRPAGFARRSVPRPAGALTCIGRGVRKWPSIRPAGFARRSVPQGGCPAFRPRISRKGRPSSARPWKSRKSP